MAYYVNGLILDGNFYAITFKRSKNYDLFIENNYLNIRGPFNSSLDIFNAFSSTHPNIFLGIYDTKYPVQEGYYFIRERSVTINNYRIVSNSLKDRVGIISIRLRGKYTISNLLNAPVPALALATEDYIFILMDENSTFADFDSALMSINNSGIFRVTSVGPNSIFTTGYFMPFWTGDSITLPDQYFIDLRYYYNYHIDFKDYAVKLFDMMSKVLDVKVIHHSEYLRLSTRDVAFVTYKIEYQDKLFHAVYRKIPPFDTHHYCTAKINFSFYSSDLLISRGFINDYYWFEKLTNNVTLVCINKYPGTEGYCATVKWNLEDANWDIETVIEDISSDRQYYQFQYDFSAELWYFYVRKRRAPVEIENIFAVLAEPNPYAGDCSNLREMISRFLWTIGINNVTFSNPNNIPNIQING